MGDESKLDAGLVGVSQDDPQMPSQSDSGHCGGGDLGRMQGGVGKEEDMDDHDHQDNRLAVKIKSGTEEEEAEEQEQKVKLWLLVFENFQLTSCKNIFTSFPRWIHQTLKCTNSDEVHVCGIRFFHTVQF